MTWGKTLLVVVGAIVAVEGIRLVGAVHQPPPSRTVVVREAASPPRAAAADPAVNGLRGRLAHLEQRVDDVETADDAPRTDDDATAPAPPTVAELREAIGARLADEQRDSSWSYAQEQAIAGAFEADDFAGNHLVEAECRATVCRVVVSHDDDAAHERFSTNLPFSGPFVNTQGVLDRSEDGSRTVLYTSRPGMRLAELSPRY